jgi:hypothetical protein
MNIKVKSAGKSRKEIKQAERRRKQLLGRAAWGLAGVVALTLIGYVVWGLIRPKPGQSVPQLSRTHIQLGDQHEPYNSDPPTSGPHAEPVRAGFYDEAPPDENLVHNLEHGYVIFWYKCAAPDDSQCQSLKTQIKDVIERAKPVVIGTDIKKLIAVPRPTMDARIALTSWGRIDKLISFNELEIMEFINDFRNVAPEPGAP